MIVSGSYASDSSDGDGAAPPADLPRATTTTMSVSREIPAQVDRAVVGLVPATARRVEYNVEADLMYAPTYGPEHPLTGSAEPRSAVRNTLTGYVESAHISDVQFDEEYHAALQPRRRGRKRKAGRPGKFTSPWAPTDQEAQKVADGDDESEADEPAEEADRPATDSSGGGVVADEPEVEKGQERTILHGASSPYDYQGRTYMWRPSGLKPSPTPVSYIPEKKIHTYSGHSKGVNCIRFIPFSGHLLLSASMDHKVKLWDVYNERRPLRTFLGHSKPVRKVSFNNRGDRFLSTSYDGYVKLWDTETGQCLQRFTLGKTPFCAEFHPWDSKQHEFLVGQSDKKIIQWDCRASDTVPAQTYDEHLGAVNAILFVDEGRRFVSTADDKKMLIWEYGIPVVIKHIAEPELHSMPVLVMHPSNAFFAAQSMDNQILIVSVKDRFKLNRKKCFTGHQVAGYAAGMAFSPDGRWLCSGDGSGRTFFWDFKTTRVLERIQTNAKDQIVMDVQWHPVEPSRVATCSWDSTITLWDGAKNK